MKTFYTVTTKIGEDTIDLIQQGDYYYITFDSLTKIVDKEFIEALESCGNKSTAFFNQGFYISYVPTYVLKYIFESRKTKLTVELKQLAEIIVNEESYFTGEKELIVCNSITGMTNKEYKDYKSLWYSRLKDKQIKSIVTKEIINSNRDKVILEKIRIVEKEIEELKEIFKNR